MLKTFAAALLVLTVSPAFATNCLNSPLSSDLIRCSKIQVDVANAKFAVEAKRLSSTAAINARTRLALAKYYQSAKKQLGQNCQTTYPDSRLHAMYANACLAGQIELLTLSQRKFRCSVQQDGQDCAAH